MDSSDRIHQQVLAAIKCSNQMDSIIKEHEDEFVLPEHAHVALVDVAFAFLQLNTSLGNHFHPQGIALFNTTMKYHYLMHSCLRSKLFIPIKGWCFGGESFLKHMKRIIQKNAHGTHLLALNDKVTQGYLEGLHIALAEAGCQKLFK